MWVLLVSISLGAVTAGYIAAGSPGYFRDFLRNDNPDAKHYVILGRNFWERGHYSRMTGPPYAPDIMRTPVYPLIAGGLDLACRGVWGVYAFQLLCTTALAIGTYALGCAVFGRRPALAAGLLVAADLSLIVLCFESMSECVFNLLATMAVIWWAREVYLSSDRPARHWSALGIGALLGVSILTRPAGLYLPLVMSGVWVVLAVARRRPRLAVHALILLVASYLPVIPWIARNYAVFGAARLTTADPINLVYFAGAGAYATHHQITLTEAQEIIRKEHDLASLGESNNFWVSDREVTRIDSELRAASPKVLLKYPGALCRASLIGIGKALIAHNAGTLSEMAGSKWVSPGLGTAFRGDVKTFASRLSRNDPVPVAVFVWELLFALALPVFAVLGAAIGVARPPLRLPAVCLLLIAAYYTLTIAVVGLDAYARHRSPLIPLMCLLAALALTWRAGARPGSGSAAGDPAPPPNAS